MNLWPQNNGFRGINDERRVMVMADDIAVRNNRLSLLQQLRELFLHVADISYLDVK